MAQRGSGRQENLPTGLNPVCQTEEGYNDTNNNAAHFV